MYEFFSSEAGNTGAAANDEEINLRAVVYYPKMASYAEVHLTGFIDLRQVCTHRDVEYVFGMLQVVLLIACLKHRLCISGVVDQFYHRRALQVVGPLQQPLAYAWRQEQRTDEAAKALFNFIFRTRAMIRAGTWEDNVGNYVEHGSDFTVLLKRSRLYRSIKQTPIHRSGEQDAQFNSGQLIDDVIRRGRKLSITQTH